MTLTTTEPAGPPPFPMRVLPLGFLGRGRARRLVQRHMRAYRRAWLMIVSGFFEPFFYLLSIGLGLNHLVGHLHLAGRSVTYATYVAPGLLASSAMNGSVLDATFATFFQLRITKSFEAILATPLRVKDIAVGQISWSVMRGSLYATAFLCVMAALGLVATPWAVLCLPAAVLVCFTFASVGVGLTCFMRTWQDFDFVLLAIMPFFLFSAVFYPLTVYPGWLQEVVRLTPLYQGVVLIRSLDAGQFTWTLLVHAGYLLLLGLAGLTLAIHRLGRLLLR
jgi:lipooligosaccharide transport system permease protein